MKSKLIVGSLLVALLAGLGMSPVMAQDANTPGIDRSQQEISTRIQQGLASGNISNSEAQALHQREREIQIRESRFKSDRYASPEERQRLRDDLAALRAEVERIITTPRVVPQDSDTPGIDRSQQEISARIQQGLASGNISNSEAQSLHQREREIQIRESRFKSNGNASPEERQQLRQELAALRAEVERIISSPRVVAQPPERTREFTMSDRIEQGISSGQITERQARRFHRRDRDIERHEARFNSDGILTPKEKRTLRMELSSLRNDVERLMRDDREKRYTR